MPATTPTTYNNLPGTLAARKLMYTLIPSRAHGETYDPSHDVWQNIDPVEVIKASDMSRIQRVHVKGTRNLQNSARGFIGARSTPCRPSTPNSANKAGVPIPANEWDRHHYEPMLPGFRRQRQHGLARIPGDALWTGDSRAVCDRKRGRQFGPHGQPAATVQGFRAAVLCLAPIVWPLIDEVGYQYDQSNHEPLKHTQPKDIPVVTMKG